MTFKDTWEDTQSDFEALLQQVDSQYSDLGKRMGLRGIHKASDSFKETLDEGFLSVVEAEIVEAETLGRATAKQILIERRKAFKGLILRFSLIASLLGVLAVHVKPPPLPSVVGITLISWVGAIVSDERI